MVFATAAAPALFGLLFQSVKATRLILAASAGVMFACWPASQWLKHLEGNR